MKAIENIDPKYIYYEEPGIVLLQGECELFLPSIPIGPIDLLLTDPPYGNDYDPRGMTKRRGNWCPSQERERIKNNSVPFNPSHLLSYKAAIIWGGNFFADKLPAKPGWIIWDKRETTPSNLQADCELAWTDILTVNRIHRQLWNGLARRGEENISKGVWRVHPFQKPVELMRYCLSLSGIEPGSLVLDPYMGSGPIAQACKEMNFKYIGIEIEAEYLDSAIDRLRQGVII